MKNLGKGLMLVLATLLVGISKNADTLINRAVKNYENVLLALGRSVVLGAVKTNPSWERDESYQDR